MELINCFGLSFFWVAETKNYEDIESIPERFYQEAELNKTVKIEEIKNRDYNLKPSKYLENISDVVANEVSFSELFDEIKDTIEIDDDTLYKQVTVKLYGKGSTLRGEKVGSDIGTKRRKSVNVGDLVTSKIDAKSGALALIPKDTAQKLLESVNRLDRIDDSIFYFEKI